MKMKFIVAIVALISIVGWGPFSIDSANSSTHIESKVGSTYWVNKVIKTVHAQASNLNPEVLKVGLNAYIKARNMGLNQKPLLTLVDYSKSSREKRLWVIDLKNLKVLFNTWVAHGSKSGNNNAISFSNSPRSLKSSLGVFLTDEPYIGGNGYSLRVKGLEQNINSNAYRRNIVFHGAYYVGADIARSTGRVGRSWGCFAVDKGIARSLINTIKENTLVVAYYPDQHWLKNSKFVN